VSRFGRYLLAEILPLYLAGLALILLLLLGSFLLEVVAEVLARGVPATLVAQYLLFKLPSAAGAGIPLALLFAALLGFSRLADDSELKAARLLGLGPRAFLVPTLLLGVIVAVVAVLNNELVVPAAERQAQEVEREILLRSPETVLEEGAFFTDAQGRALYLEQLLPGGGFRGVVVIQPGGVSGPQEVITAQQGRYDEEQGVWELEDIELLVMRENRVTLEFRAQEATMPVRGLAAAPTSAIDPVYLPIDELWAQLQEGTPRQLPAEWTALHRKFAEPLAAIAFALFALAVTMVTYRTGTSLGLVSVLLLTFVYYATWSVSKLLGAQGTITPALGGWAPFLLYAVAPLVMLTWAWRR